MFFKGILICDDFYINEGLEMLGFESVKVEKLR